MSRLKVAVVGCGFVAKKRHIPAFLKLKREVNLCAVCDLNINIARVVAQKFGVHDVYSDVSEMLVKEDLDIVDVCTPPQVHAPLAVEALERGCHVLLEKPMAIKVSDCDRMIRASQKSGSKLSVVHNQIFYPPFLKAQELVEHGSIGKLTGMRILSLTHRNEYMPLKDHWIHKLPGGVVGETGPHAVYMSLAFLNDVKGVSVLARKSLDYPWVTYDDYRIELEGQNMTSSIIISHANDCTACEVEIFGKKGSIKLDLQSMLLMKYKRKDNKPVSLALSSLNVATQIASGVIKNAFRKILRGRMLGHDIMIQKFVNSIISDHPAPVSAEAGRETVRVMEMIVKKVEEKQVGCVS